MHAIILVGGRGTRLQPLTDTRPKPMLPIAGEPFLARQLAWLRSHGVDAVTFACGFLPDAFRDHFGDGSGIGMQLTYAIEPAPLDTAGAIAFAARTLPPQRLLVCNGDVLTGLDVGRLVAHHEAVGAVATIALTPVEDPTRYGLVRTRRDGSVTAFVEKPPLEECDTNLISAGTYLLEAEVMDRIPEGVRCNIEREVFPKLVGAGLHAVADDSYWRDIGTFPSYLAANIDVITGRVPGAGGAVVGAAGGPCIDAHAHIDADAHIGDDVVVAAGAVVGPGASIDASVVLEGAVIGAGARIVGAIVADGAVVPAGSVIGPGSVVTAAVAVHDAAGATS